MDYVRCHLVEAVNPSHAEQLPQAAFLLHHSTMRSEIGTFEYSVELRRIEKTCELGGKTGWLSKFGGLF